MRLKDGGSRTIKGQSCQLKPQQRCSNLLDCTSFSLWFFYFILLGVKSLGPSPTLEGSVQNLELKFCSRATVKCASGTVGAVKVCARTPGVCSCALLKLYCLCRRERLRPTRLFFYFFNFCFYILHSLSLFLVLSFSLSHHMIQSLFFPGVLSLGFGPVFDGKDVIGASVIAQSSPGQTSHMMSGWLKDLLQLWV